MISFKVKSDKIHKNKYDYSLVDYTTTETKIKIICHEHGIFEQIPVSHLQGKGCKSCIKKSKGELKIASILSDKKIKYEKEYTYDNCRNINPLPFDFYLPEYNILIEYDGKQHFEAIDYFGGISGLEYRQLNDKIKNEYCDSNNIKLIRIRYDENISKKLKEIENA